MSLDHHSFAREARYVDKTDFNLSPKQLDILDDWKPPQEALPPPHMRLEHATGPPLMQVTSPTDFVQDAAADCSVVASMCAGMARVENGFPSLLSGILYPYDESNRISDISPNGKYVVRLNFNGCFRKVEIDDRLPVTTNNRLLHIVDRNNPRLLWPALLEKAYLKVRGGYDFPGSNSGTDLWILTGWLPEQILLHHEDTDIDRTWDRIYEAFKCGDVIVTIGTGKMTSKTERELGLISEHDYAVLDLNEAATGGKKVLVKNPWMNGPTWKGRYGSSTIKSASSDSESSDSEPGNELVNLELPEKKTRQQHAPLPGSFWMQFQDAVQHFESLYLNWNPGLFKYRADVHFEWDLKDTRSPMNSLRTNPQYVIHPKMDGTVWVILSRHFSDDDRTAADESSPLDLAKIYTGKKALPDECYISLYAFRSDAQRVISMRNALTNHPFVDTPQTLLELDAKAREPITVVPAEQMLKSISYNFTLSVFSQEKVLLERARLRYNDSTSLTGRWSEETAGGNAKHNTYMQNPQYALHLPSQAQLSIILESTSDDLSINVRLLHGQGKRVEGELKSRDIILESGEYRRHCVVASTSKAYAGNRTQSRLQQESEAHIAAGNYTLVLSTFNPGELGNFTLTIASNVNASLNPIARSGAGRVLKRFSDVSFAPGVRRVGAPFLVNRIVTVFFVVKAVKRAIYDNNVDTAYTGMPPSPIRLSIDSGLDPDRTVITASGDGSFMDATGVSGVRTEDCQMAPTKKTNKGAAVRAGATASKTMWLVLERMGTDLGRGEERFEVESWADVPDWDQLGVWRDI